MNNPPYQPLNQPPYLSPAGQQPDPRPAPPDLPQAPKRMSAEDARRRSRILKRVALAGTTLAFCGLSGLAASHVTGVTSAAAGAAAPTVAPAQNDDHGGFFPSNGEHSDDGDHQNGQDGGFNFGSGGGGFQPPSSSSGGS